MANNKKTIVTGGAGFIGSHLVDKLLGEGYKVTVLDNFSSSNGANLKHNRNNKNLNVFEADIADLDSIKEYFTGAETVYHLAALADIVPSIVNPTSYYRSNVLGTFNVVEAARLANVKKLVYAASSSCYGIPDKFPTPETAKIKPEYPYALTKYLGEEAVMHWAKVYKLPVVSLRLFNVFGPRSRTCGAYGAVFGVFLAQKLANKPFTVVGDGKQTRDFTFVKDVVDAFYMAAQSDCKNEIFNVGSGGTYSINNLVKLLGGEITYIPKRPGEPECTFADISKIKKILGWKPEVKFKDGVKIMLENINNWKEAPLWNPELIAEATKDWFKYLSK